jgi:hypothetical protein
MAERDILCLGHGQNTLWVEKVRERLVPSFHVERISTIPPFRMSVLQGHLGECRSFMWITEYCCRLPVSMPKHDSIN